MKLFVLCMLVAVAYSLPLESEGVAIKKVSALDSRIFNGREATLGQFPWQASLTIYFNFAYASCGGSLIQSQWVLTAAHCLKINGHRANRISILLGTIDTANASGAIFRDSSEYYTHDDYNNTYYNDIALVKLNETVRYTDNVRAIILGNQLLSRSHVQLSGFGTRQEGSTNTKLLYAELITISQVDCIREHNYPALYSQVCATAVSGSSCAGDSGSALVMQDNDVWKQFGVLSGSVKQGCQLDTSVFSRTSSYWHWIAETIQLHN